MEAFVKLRLEDSWQIHSQDATSPCAGQTLEEKATSDKPGVKSGVCENLVSPCAQ